MYSAVGRRITIPDQRGAGKTQGHADHLLRLVETNSFNVIFK